MQADTASSTRAPRTARLAAAVRWLLPAVGLAMVPKCPACLAGYVAVATGFSLSFSTATHLRLALLALCLATLSFLIVRTFRHRTMIGK